MFELRFDLELMSIFFLSWGRGGLSFFGDYSTGKHTIDQLKVLDTVNGQL